MEKKNNKRIPTISMISLAVWRAKHALPTAAAFVVPL